MKNITELIGIIKGINYDGVINEREVQHLQKWIAKNRNLAYEKNEIEFIKLMDSILEDNVIDEQERKIMIEQSKNLLCKLRNSNEKLYELNGIIEGIVCDKEINEAEVYRLKEWMDEYGDDVRNHKPSVDLIKMIDDILDDGIVTEEEQEALLKTLEQRIMVSQFETKLEYLCKQVKARKNIGVDLIDILDDESAMEKIHRKAEKRLLQRLKWNVNSDLPDSEIIVISLVLIAMLEYDGNYYASVRATYTEAYDEYSEQKIEGMIRSVLGRFKRRSDSGDRSRIINVALENAIVPQEYLTAFFEFIYDIYKLNFEYELPNNLYEEFRFVFEGLRNNVKDRGDELSLNVTQKTYKLISSTKKLFVSEEGIDAIIKLSIVIVKLIDKRYWNKLKGVYNPYLKIGFEGWEKQLQKESAHGKSFIRKNPELYSQWEPKFVFLNQAIYLVPPIHKIKSSYDYRDVIIVVENGSEEIYRNEKCDIREIIGGYQIKSDKIRLENPIGELRYKLLAGNEIIYDSKMKLNREHIIFDFEGEEINNNTEYEGTAYFCLELGNYDLQIMCKESRYIVVSKLIRVGDTLTIGDRVFEFSPHTKSRVLGELHNNCILRDENYNKELYVYKKVKGCVFECESNSSKIEITLNEQRYRLSELKHTSDIRGKVTKYFVEFALENSGIYNVEVNQIIEGKKREILRETIVYDRELKYSFEILNEYLYEVSVETGLLTEPIKKEVSIENFKPNFIKIEREKIVYSYLLAFDFGMVTIDGDKWQSNASGIWGEDIQHDSILSLFDSKCDELLVYSEKGELLESDVMVTNKRYYVEVSIGFLNSYKQANRYVNLVFTKDGQKKYTVLCYNKCVIIENETEIFQDDIEKKIHVTPIYYGKNKVYFEMISKDNEVIHKSGNLESGQTEVVNFYDSFQEYTFNFYEKKKFVMLGKKENLLQRKCKFYFLKDFVECEFKVDEVYFNQYVRGEFMEKSFRFNKIFLKINELVERDKFKGEIFVKTYKSLYSLGNINPIEIEVCSQIIDNTMDVYITNNGDGLLMDFEHRGIMNMLEHPTAPDIFLYTINVEGEI